ncbi:MAG: peptidyl-prolyl cis-trans isomerase [Planctomycetes bacterium]|nr:peptidyl-prolyl cis-trans isomerase [Planctomycetota bacterium]
MIPFAIGAIAVLLQGPDEVLARYQLDGKPAVVTRSDVAIEMGLDLCHKDVGRQAAEVLVDSEITRREAERLKLMPTDAEVRAFWDQLKAQLRAAGRDPANFAAVRNSTESEWLRDLALQLAQERLVRRALDLDAGEAVSGDMLRLWLAEQRKVHTVVDDRSQLAPGIAARVDGRDLPILELGLLLLRTSEDGERERYIRQVAFLASIEREAEKLDVLADDAAIEAAITARRRDVARDPRYRGLTFEQLLETQGLSVELLRQRRVFRAKVLQEQITARLHPDAELRRELAADRDGVVAEVGARRRLGIVFRRALEEPNALVPNDFAAAAASLERVKQRLELERFEMVARIETDDPAGKESGGDTGWLQRASDRLPEVVLAAAFAATAGEVVGPLRGPDGCYLVKVLDVEPDLTDDQLVERLRVLRGEQVGQQILERADIRLGDGSGKDGR